MPSTTITVAVKGNDTTRKALHALAAIHGISETAELIRSAIDLAYGDELTTLEARFAAKSGIKEFQPEPKQSTPNKKGK